MYHNVYHILAYCIITTLFCGMFQLLRGARASSQQVLHTDVITAMVNTLGSESLDIVQKSAQILAILGNYWICVIYCVELSHSSGTLAHAT